MMTPEQAQVVRDLRLKMQENIRKGVPPHEGISKEEIQAATDYMRSNRIVSGAAGGKKSKSSKTKIVTEDAPAILARLVLNSPLSLPASTSTDMLRPPSAPAV